MENSVPYHCPKCRSTGQQAVFSSLPELRQHILKVHFNQEPLPASSTSLPPDSFLPKENISKLTAPLANDPRLAAKEGRHTQGLAEAEQLAQAKRYLLKEAMKSTEQSREQIRKLNEDIKIKESSLDTAVKKLSTLSEKNQNMEEEYNKMEEQNRNIRNELEELKAKLMEKESLLEKKNKELADQLNYVKSIEEKEAIAKERLERTVEKIIERAETAEKNLELMRLSTASPNLVTENRSKENFLGKEVEPYQRTEDLQAVLESCNTASNAAYRQASSSDPQVLTRIATPVDSKQTPLVQVYLKNFLDKYNELKARDYAFNQAMPAFSNVPQVQVNQYDLEPPQNDLEPPRQRTRPERDVYNGEENVQKNNFNNSNNNFRNQHPVNLNTKHGFSPRSSNRSKAPAWSNYDADDDDDDPLTDVTEYLDEEDDPIPFRRTVYTTSKP